MLSDLRLRRHAELPVTPWRNGGGRTRELLLITDAHGAPLTRVSMAEVASDGPFSAYPGVARVLTVVTGDPLELTIDGTVARLGRGEVLSFSGDASTECRLTGCQVEDLGVMTWPREGRPATPARLVIVPAEGLRVGPEHTLAVVVAEPVRAGSTPLRTGDSLQVRATPVTLRGEGRVALVTA